MTAIAPPQPTDLEHRLAEIAHDAWRLTPTTTNTTPTPPTGRSGSEQRTHDALRPFSELDAVDQRDTLYAALGTVSLDDLGNAVGYNRGPDREFRPHELTESMRVRSADGDQSGHVTSWTTSPDGVFVEWITVRFDDGSELRTHAAERALQRTE